ncbi:MAG: SGNH/GDSL hydrolase family protein [Opitutaceae bacterium]|jgi:lysophospholipase L1-like esterase
MRSLLPFFLSRILLALLLAPLVHAETPSAFGGLFRDGDRWVAVGDSITHNGTYHAWVQAYYATRFPELRLDTSNAGISGDIAAGALRRYDWDIAPMSGTVATIMLGMNDVGRTLYAAGDVTPDLERRRADALVRHREAMVGLVRRLRADGIRVILLTPSPFDQTANLKTANLPGVNDALAVCADFARELVATDPAALSLIDLHGPLTALNTRLQQDDPAFTLIGPDRVHPTAPGHLLMAYHILKAQSAPADVARVTLAADTLQITETHNAAVTALARPAADRLTFTVHARALPFPIDPAARPALDWVPFLDDLNREILRITGLAPGDWTLAVDGQSLRAYTADELAVGVNLAAEANTPQNRQATLVLNLIKRRCAIEASGPRTLAQIEHGPLNALPRPISFEAAQPVVERKLAELRASDNRRAAYFISIHERYLEMKPKEAETRAELARLAEEIRAAARPVARTYTLARR